jgi:RNA polymerase sigma factor for flagellar operon FliA
MKSRAKKLSMSEDELEDIVKSFLPFIKHTAYRISWKARFKIHAEDLVSIGVIGLLDALKRYDGRAKLKTFTSYRIEGAMLDALRLEDGMPRSLKRKLKFLFNAKAALSESLCRMPSEEETAEHMRISLDEYFGLLAKASHAWKISIEDMNERSQNSMAGHDFMESIADPGQKDPLKTFEENSAKKEIASLLRGLNRRERLVLLFYYWEELTMKEIGRVIGLTESRVCQIHGKAIGNLRAKLTGDNGRSYPMPS